MYQSWTIHHWGQPHPAPLIFSHAKIEDYPLGGSRIKANKD